MDADIVCASLDFFDRNNEGQLPFVCLAEDGSSEPYISYELKEQTVMIENIRGKEEAYTLDTSGFQFLKSSTQHSAFANKDEFEHLYISEAVEMTKRLTGARKIIPFEPVLRRHIHELDHITPQPVKFAHIDITSAAAAPFAAALAGQSIPADEVEGLLKGRFQVINLWRPIAHAAVDRPLAVCDYRSIDAKEDLVTLQLRYLCSDRVGQYYLMKYNPLQKWKYLRGMNIDEVLLFKSYDSLDATGVARFSGHASFEDPTTPDGAPLRESAEVRMLVFYGD